MQFNGGRQKMIWYWHLEIDRCTMYAVSTRPSPSLTSECQHLDILNDAEAGSGSGLPPEPE